VYNNEIVSASNNSNCVDLDYCPFALVDNNFLRGDTMPLNINGITVDHCINTTLSNNEIHGVPVGDGIVTFTSAGPIAINTNIIYGFSRGIWDPDAVTGLIVGNEIYSCSSAIRLNNTGSNWTGINNNLLYNCTSAGLYFTCPLANVTGNLINDTGIGLDALNNLTAHCNAIFDNSVAGLNLQVNGTFDVTNNYWGDNSGPNVNGAGPGTGDAITTNGHTVLTFDPWAAMVLSATPPAITADGTSLSTLDLDCTRNSAGVVMGCDIPDGLRVIFATTGGTLTSATTYTHGGHAITALRSSTTPGIFTVTSAFGMAPDMTLSTTIVTFTAIPPEPVQNGINAGPGSHGSSLIAGFTPGTLQLPNVNVTSARLSAASVSAGSPVKVSADVSNTGGASGAAVVKVYLNGEVAGSQGVEVAGGSTTPVTFNVTPSQPGDYSVRVNNVSAGTLKVTGGNDSDIIFAVAFAAFVVLVLSLLVVYLRRRRIAA